MNTAQCTPIQHSPLQSNPIPISHTHVNVMDCAHTHNYMDCAMLAALDHDAGCKMFLFFSQGAMSIANAISGRTCDKKT